MWLETPTSLTDLEVADPKGGPRKRVNLHCVLKVNVVPVPAAHFRIPVVQATRQMANPAAMNSSSIAFRSDSSQLDDQDLKEDVGDWPSKTTRPFMTAPHEIGHLLGYHHPFEGNPAASIPGNDPYCVVSQPDCDTVMGLGDALRASYAAPWQRAAALWFNSDGKGYTFRPSDFPASLTRLAPVNV